MPMKIKKQTDGPSWACGCPAIKQYPPDRMLAVLARAVEVKVEKTTRREGTWTFLAGSGDEMYDVTYWPESKVESQVCKHIAACAAVMCGPWLTEMFELVRDREEERKKDKRMLKKITIA